MSAGKTVCGVVYVGVRVGRMRVEEVGERRGTFVKGGGSCMFIKG